MQIYVFSCYIRVVTNIKVVKMKRLFILAVSVMAMLTAISCEKAGNASEIDASELEGSWYVMEQTFHGYKSGDDITLRFAEIYTFSKGKVSLSMEPGIRPADYFQYPETVFDFNAKNGVFSNWKDVEFTLEEGILTIKGKGSNGLGVYVMLSRTEPAGWDELVRDTKKFVGDITAFTWYINSVSADLLGTGKPTDLPLAYTAEFNETVVLTLDPSTSLDSYRQEYGSLEAYYDIEAGTFMTLSDVVYDTSKQGKLAIRVKIPNGESNIDASFNLVNTKPSDWDTKVSQFASMAPFLIGMLDGIISK